MAPSPSPRHPTIHPPWDAATPVASRVGAWRLSANPATITLSPAAAPVFGRDATGVPLPVQAYLDWVHPDDRPMVSGFLTALLHANVRQGIQYRVLSNDKAEIVLHHEISHRGDAVIGIAADGVLLDATLQAANLGRTQALLAIADNVARLSETDLFKLALGWCESLTGSAISFLHFINADERTIELVTWSDATLENYCRVTELATHYPIAEAGIWAKAFHTRKPVVVNDYASVTHRHGLPEGHARLDRFISFPVIEHGHVKMLFGVGNKVGRYSAIDVESLSVIADYMWRLVSRQRAERREQAARREIAMLSSAMEQSPSGVMITDPDGVIDYVNPAFERITEYPAHQVRGLRPAMLTLSGAECSDGPPPWGHLSPGQTWRGHLEGQTKHGRRLVTRVTAAPVVDAAGAITHILAIHADITEERETQAALAAERAANRMQRDFVSMVSHEFRTPLAVIDATAQRVARRADRFSPDDIHDRMEECRGMIRHLTDLVDGVLGLSRLETGRIAFTPVRLDLTTVIAGCVRTHGVVAPNRVIVWNPPDQSLDVVCDGDMARVILANLIGNGLKYSKAPTPVTVAARRDNGHVAISVKDEGQGIPTRDQARLFERFFRATNTTGTSGTGIGLFLADTFARMHGGRVTFQSREGIGSTFTLTLPVDGPDDEDRGAVPGTSGGHAS